MPEKSYFNFWTSSWKLQTEETHIVAMLDVSSIRACNAEGIWQLLLHQELWDVVSVRYVQEPRHQIAQKRKSKSMSIFF